MSKRMSREPRYKLSNSLIDCFPNPEKWGVFFDSLNTFFIKQGVIWLLPVPFFSGKENAKKSMDRLARDDSIHIMRNIIGKTFGFKKPFESLTRLELAQSNAECGVFLPGSIPDSSFDTRIACLAGANYIVKFCVSDENGHFYSANLRYLIEGIRPELAQHLKAFKIDINCRPEEYKNIEQKLPRELLSIHKKYTELFVDEAQKVEQLSRVIDNCRTVRPLQYESFEEARESFSNAVKKYIVSE